MTRMPPKRRSRQTAELPIEAPPSPRKGDLTPSGVAERVAFASARLVLLTDPDATVDVEGALVKVAPVLTASESEAFSAATVSSRLIAAGAIGVVVAPDVRPERDTTRAEQVERAASISAAEAIREWAAGVKGAIPDELDDAVKHAIALAEQAGV